jgi:spermidine/putrescine transport system permease protein
MQSLIQVYGRSITTLIWLLACIWVLGLVVIPQLFMVERSLWWRERPADAFQITQSIDRLYSDVMLWQMDLRALGAEQTAERAELEAQIAGAQAEITRLEEVEATPTKVYGLQNYFRMSGLHFRIFIKTIGYAVLVTLLSLVVCYPVAYTVAQLATPQSAALLLLGLIVPYAINELLRVYAWLMILDYQGLLNTFLAWLGVVDLEQRTWIPFLEYPGSVFVALVYAYVLFMVFPIYNTMQTLDKNQIEAARDLGASIWRIHWRVVIPHAKPGIAVGCIMTFMLSAGSYAVPQVMTRGRSGDWFSQLIYRQFFESFNWNTGAAYSFTLLLVCIVFIFLMMALFRVGMRDIAK